MVVQGWFSVSVRSSEASPHHRRAFSIVISCGQPEAVPVTAQLGSVRGMLAFGIFSSGLFHNTTLASPKIPAEAFKFYSVIICNYTEWDVCLIT